MINPFTTAQSFNDLDQLLRIEELYLLQRVAQKISAIFELETLLDEIAQSTAS